MSANKSSKESMEVYEDMISNIELQSNNIDIKDNNMINYMIEEEKES